MRDHRLARPRPLPSSRKPLGIVPSAFCPCLVSLFIRLCSPCSDRQSGQNRSSDSSKPLTRGTQTLDKGRSEIVPDKLKPLTRGANQIQSRRSDRQSPRNRPSESPKHPTRGTQTLHKGRSETAQGELKTPTRGTNPPHRTGFVPLDELGETQLRRRRGTRRWNAPAPKASDCPRRSRTCEASRQRSRRTSFAQFCVRRKPTAFKEIRPSHRPVPPFRPRNPPHADDSFRPTDFVVQGNRLFDNPYRLFLLRLRGRSDESYGPRSARFPNFAAPPRSAAHSPRHSALYLAPIRPRGGSPRNSALCLAGRGCSIQSPIPAPQSPLSRLYGIIAFLWKTTAS